MKINSLFTLLFAGACLAGASSISSELHVVTSVGPVTGRYNNSAGTVRGFIGIPYAEPPVKHLRFAPPQPKLPIGPIDAISFRSPCPQTYSYSNESIWSVLPYEIWNSADISEDCLYINIWAPSHEHRTRVGANKKAAVMMFVHGGGFGSGAGSVGFYDGTNLVQDNDDIIVVTFNYRLNIFGFPNAPGLKPSDQNVGLLDQRLAVEWVHKNIADFGGDPNKILLFGQSAGAASTDLYAYAYPKDPLVSAIGMESGTVSLITNTDYTNQNWNKISTTVGCGVGEGSLECMRQISMQRIIQAMSNGSYNFVPIVDNRTVFSDYSARAESGRFAKLPTLAGDNTREISALFSLSLSSVNETEIYDDFQGTFNCPLQESVRIRLEQKIPTWRYLYHGNFTNLSPTSWLGAYHTSEVPMVFGTYNMSLSETGPASMKELATSRYIQDAWVEFAKDPQNGLHKFGWPQFNFDGDTLINLALNNTPPAVFTSSKDWDSPCNGATFVP